MQKIVLLLALAFAACAADPVLRQTIEDEDAGPAAQALTGPVGYTYVNSNNGQALSHELDVQDPLNAAIRCWAMSYHANNGHNYWTCNPTSDRALYCYHTPTPTSGVTSLYLDNCSVSNTAPWSCDMHISNDWQCACEKPKMGTLTWSPSGFKAGEFRSYAFDDGTIGSCSAANGNGLFQEWSQ